MSGNAAGHWQVTYSAPFTVISPTPAGVAAGLSGSPYSIVMANGDTYTITAVAGKSARTLAEMKAYLEAGIAYGTNVWLRGEGDWTTSIAAVTAVFSGGTWTAPSNYSGTAEGYAKGVDLNTGTYVVIKPHAGETVTIQRPIYFNKTAVGAYGRIRFSGLNFYYTEVDNGSEINDGILRLIGGSHFAVDNCTFSTGTIIGTPIFSHRHGIHAVYSGADLCHNLVIQDCEIHDCYIGIFAIGGPTNDWCFVGNYIHDCINDFVRVPPGSRGRYCWNYMRNTPVEDYGGAHPDFVQMDATNITVDLDDIWLVGNTIVRGDSLAGRADGQGLFIADLGATGGGSTNIFNRPLAVGNRILISFTNGIYFSKEVGSRTVACADSSFIRNNTVINDPSAASNLVYVRFDGSVGGTNTDQQYNIVNANGQANDLNVLYAAYGTYFVGGQGMIGSGIGSTLAAVSANLAIKSGSPADTASPKVGAHQDYFDYAARTISALPYYGTFPTHP